MKTLDSRLFIKGFNLSEETNVLNIQSIKLIYNKATKHDRCGENTVTSFSYCQG